MTEQEVKKLLKKADLTWTHFINWMAGQTVGMNKDGTVDYYEVDVKKFILSKGVYSNPEEWD